MVEMLPDEGFSLAVGFLDSLASLLRTQAALQENLFDAEIQRGQDANRQSTFTRQEESGSTTYNDHVTVMSRQQ
jgi:hypothetical protein